MKSPLDETQLMTAPIFLGIKAVNSFGPWDSKKKEKIPLDFKKTRMIRSVPFTARSIFNAKNHLNLSKNYFQCLIRKRTFINM